MVGEGRQHLPLALEEELLGREAHAILVREAGAGLDAQQHVVRDRVFLAQVVHVVGGHQLETRAGGDLGHALVDLGQFFDAGLLHLQVDVALPEDVYQPLHFGVGGCVLAELQSLGEAAAGAAREADEAVGMLAQEGVVHARLVVVALQEGGAPQRQQIAVSGLVAGQQGQVPAFLVVAFLAEAILHQVGLQPDDGLDACAAALLVELDDARQDPVVGYGHGRHAQLYRPAHQLVQFAGPIQSRVMSVHMQVAEARLTFRRVLCTGRMGLERR